MQLLLISIPIQSNLDNVPAFLSKELTISAPHYSSCGAFVESKVWPIIHIGGSTMYVIIAQVYRLSAVHCQMTRYSQRVPGYLTRYSVSQWNLFWQKNQPIRLCLSNQVRPGMEWFPSPLGDFNRLFEGLIGELFKIWHWNMFYFFLNDISLAPKM